MRTPKKTKPALPHPEIRSLTIQSKRGCHVKPMSIPEIRFNGKWLYDLGFAPGAKVTVISKQGLLIIQPEG